MPPEYSRHGILSPAVDVYAYGMILLEVISGKKSYVPRLQDDEYVTWTVHVSKYLIVFLVSKQPTVVLMTKFDLYFEFEVQTNSNSNSRNLAENLAMGIDRRVQIKTRRFNR